MQPCSHAPKRGPSLSTLGLAVLGLASSFPPAFAQVAVTTQNYDNARSGANTAETALTPSNVSQAMFGKLFTISALAAPVGGQVLYVPNVTIGGGAHNVLYAYQVNDADNSACALSAFDADTGVTLWNTPLPASAKYTTATPVIDTAAALLYLLTKTGTDATGQTFLHAFNIQTGAEAPNGHIQVQASVAGTGDGTVNGVVSFDGPSTGTYRFHANDRPGLLLVNGTVYAAFAHNSDSFPYHGWVLAYTYSPQSGFTQTAKFCTTPNGSDGGIWMSGKGLAADGSGNIYCTVGNGTFDANAATGSKTEYGMCYLKLSPSLQVLDWFAPHDEGGFSQSDLDTGNSGVVGIPGTTRLFGGATKFGTGFLLDSTALGGFTPGGPDKAVLRLDGLSGNDNVGQNPIAWDTGGLKYVYLWPRSASLEQFAYDPAAGTFSGAGVYKQASALTDGGPLTVSSSAGRSAILWAVGRTGVVHALDATDVSRPELWNSAQNASRDGLGSVGHFQFPVVANGKVYVPNGSSTSPAIAVYGLLPVAVSGKIGLQAVQPGSMGQSLTFTLTPTGTTAGAAITQTVTLAAADGSFTLPSVPAGTYTLGVKGAKWLRADVPLDTTGGPITGLSVSLLAGDVNGDNQTTGADLALMRAAYGTSAGQTGFNANADLNCDGQVTGADLAILRANYGLNGAP